MRTIKFVFIDEIQDYSAQQIRYLKSLFPNSRFTMLGDLNQAIFKNKQKEKTLLDSIKPLFDEDKISQIDLTKTYRSTADITNFTKGILLDSQMIEAFDRKGELPQIVVRSSYKEIIAEITQVLKKTNEVSTLTAIIGKTKKECEEAYAALKDYFDLTLISKENQKLADGLIILPSYLAKGLEFDTVIVLDASANNYQLESERTLLYTICSRAMHRLIVTSHGAISPLLADIPSDLYQLT